jgi:hypothetical protein
MIPAHRVIGTFSKWAVRLGMLLALTGPGFARDLSAMSGEERSNPGAGDAASPRRLGCAEINGKGGFAAPGLLRRKGSSQ